MSLLYLVPGGLVVFSSTYMTYHLVLIFDILVVVSHNK